jgi:Tfp pilus assembly protein PilV
MKPQNEKGFSLVEVVIALVIFMVAVMGVFITFAYAINYNAGNNARAQALTVLQQEVENLRSAKFTPAVTDSTLVGGTHTDKRVTSSDGNSYVVSVVVDDDPFTTGVQVDNTKTIKEIAITVTLDAPTPGWQTAVPATIIMRRVRGN